MTGKPMKQRPPAADKTPAFDVRKYQQESDRRAARVIFESMNQRLHEARRPRLPTTTEDYCPHDDWL